MSLMRDHIVVRDVGPRDGLQSLSVSLSSADKIWLVRALAAAGISRIEAGSFVSPTAVPQMADSQDVLLGVGGDTGSIIEALVLDERGARRALEAGANLLVTVVAASDTFSQRNARRSTEEAIDTAGRIRSMSMELGVDCVVDVATSFGCAFEGAVPPAQVARVTAALIDRGFGEITFADTTGMATPKAVKAVLGAVEASSPSDIRWGLHFHNTRGLGLVNVVAGLDAGIRFFDSSVGGIGGCPFSPGATGNICTEDLVYLLHSLGLETGVNLGTLVGVARDLETVLGFKLPGQVMRTQTDLMSA